MFYTDTIFIASLEKKLLSASKVEIGSHRQYGDMIRIFVLLSWEVIYAKNNGMCKVTSVLSIKACGIGGIGKKVKFILEQAM